MDGQTEPPEIPGKPAKKGFLGSKAAPPIGIALATFIGILCMYFGIFNQCCGVGLILVSAVAVYIPKFFGADKTKVLAVFVVAYFIILTLVGTFAVTKPMFENDCDTASYNSEGFSNVSITIENNTAQISVTYSGTADTVNVRLYQVKSATYGFINKTNEEVSTHAMTDAGGGTYTATVPDIASDFVYVYSFTSTTGDTTTASINRYYLGAISDSELTKFSLMWNAYNCGIIAILAMILVALNRWSAKSLEKTRARMEAEGRLYPQGYGRCKECGSIVLPGETCCRKCGAYIDVPEEFRHKKVDLVQCSECGAEIPEDAKTCPKCGAVFDEDEEIVFVGSEEKNMVECSECGEKVPEDAKICPKCGAVFDEEKKE